MFDDFTNFIFVEKSKKREANGPTNGIRAEERGIEIGLKFEIFHIGQSNWLVI